ncbi:MAG: hypothetical protein PHX06_06465 [Methanocorpusculum parvum]|nr:hypothetical protein [Methanocorpusculum parvum]
MIIIVIGLTIGALYMYYADVEPLDVLSIFGAAVISWVNTILFSSGNIGETSSQLVITTLADNITTYSYDLLTIPITDNVVSIVLMIVSIAITIIAMLITLQSLGSIVTKPWSD